MNLGRIWFILAGRVRNMWLNATSIDYPFSLKFSITPERGGGISGPRPPTPHNTDANFERF
jgi:hypothetical protein